MSESHRAVIARMSYDLAAISAYLNRVSADLGELNRTLGQTPAAAPPPAPAAAPAAWPTTPATPAAPVDSPVVPARPVPAYGSERSEHSEGWVGRALAVAGVAVTLTGVVLLLVLAAQAGILRPEFRVAAGAVLAAGLVGAGWWLSRRPAGRVGAIALAATGVAAAYIDVIAVTAIYDWVSAPLGLILAAAIGGGGLTLARRWKSEQLGLLVLVPLMALAPVVTDGVTLLLIGFMLALSAAALPVQFGRDWTGLFGARIAAPTLPLLVALASASIDGRDDRVLALACAVAATLAVAGGLLVLRWSTRPAATAVLTAAGVLPLLCVAAGVDRLVAALMVAALSAALVAVVALGDRIPGVTVMVRQVWSVLAATAALIAVLVAFDGPVAGPVLSAMAAVVAVAGRRQAVTRWIAIGLVMIGGGILLDIAGPEVLISATKMPAGLTVSSLIGSVLVIAAAGAISWAWAVDRTADQEVVRLVWVAAAMAAGYAVTVFAVTAGVAIGGTGAGFFGGHMVATICWIAVAAGLLGYAARRPRAQRSLPIGGGMALVAAAMAKLFLFDLGTLDGMFRVAVFIVVGLALLGMGAGYARLLNQQDEAADKRAM
ncbi:DUF2339 domain-containing protein [Mycolicibacterium fortuitum]|jgi:uncharacterized membrane protein|uniref:DUF2339 domain-containing protein n=2 Tax=Mycolicibacterium fortuitum TaxID=1766 RepID=UPI0002FCF2DB|nr:DUF2339 domain-containing protein [Mycolicibacterium fortuitum]CRL81098.1 hypothetical protein CPGR_04312 [Mycolicibacter nonchromogenicus]MCA4726714.1 DUF2339 domain-containing protein [Mycolicibacterium fortuitum]NOQ99418.1 DUF2339 domain-containing protein [Mycolicibacterium fortuitum]OBA96050.1 hypothetical protein A5668_06785 [Mycolicibacterium fortuitum]UBV18973.1 DUF2339 domain-containing protein [Mycolicibacterium fortuitum]